MTESGDLFATIKRSRILRWCAALFALLPAAFSEWMAIAVTLSYFQWSPLGYEPCGLQAIAWFLMIYPMLAIDLLIRGIVMAAYHLPWCFLLFPVVLGVVFLPMAYFSGWSFAALTGIVITLLLFLAAIVTDILFWKRSAGRS